MSKSFLILGLGSNIEPLANLRAALRLFKNSKIFELAEVSRIYESKAQVLNTSEKQPDFLNAAIKVRTKADDPNLWLLECQRIENLLGRSVQNERTKWQARTIDIDILFASNGSIVTDHLIVPHPLLLERPFALLPTLEIFPDFVSFSKLPDWALQKWKSPVPFQTQVSKKSFWTEFVSILNITPDSFSDGGKFLDGEAFLQQVHAQLLQGAETIEIGAESTRPRDPGHLIWNHNLMTSIPSSSDLKLEFERLSFALKLLSEINERFNISVDCRNPEVLADLVDHNRIDFINDVTGFRNPKLLKIARESSCRLISMHALSVPVVKGEWLDDSKDPIEILNRWICDQVQLFHEQGIDLNRVIFDPGIGFGKSAEQNWHILNNIDQLQTHGCRMLIGHSRKSFLQTITNVPAQERDAASAMVSGKLKRGFYDYLRVHEVSVHQSALMLS